MIVFDNLPVSAPLRVTNKFGERNTGIISATKNHKGVDIGRDLKNSKTNILAVMAGTVVLNYYDKNRGWAVTIKHDEKYSTLYQHMAAKSPLAEGAKVKVGDVIGTMGSTGASSGVHLHFELHENGIPIDPLPYLYNIESEAADMTESEIKEIVRKTVKEILEGSDTESSGWFKKEFAGKENELKKIWDGTRPQGYATREEAAAIAARTIGI